MDAVTIFNDFVNLVDSDDLPIEAVALADGERIVAERLSRPIRAVTSIRIRRVMCRRPSASRSKKEY